MFHYGNTNLHYGNTNLDRLLHSSPPLRGLRPESTAYGCNERRDEARLTETDRGQSRLERAPIVRPLLLPSESRLVSGRRDLSRFGSCIVLVSLALWY